jgi:hypothetical protein
MANTTVSSQTEASTTARSTVPGEFAFIPPMPRSIEETGLSLAFLADLSLKILYNAGYLTGGQLAERLRLPYTGVTEVILEFLKREQLVEVLGAKGVGGAGLSVCPHCPGARSGPRGAGPKPICGACPRAPPRLRCGHASTIP